MMEICILNYYCKDKTAYLSEEYLFFSQGGYRKSDVF